VLMGVVIATLVGCQFERAALARTPATPSGHHQSPLPHATAALDCFVATWPDTISLVPWSLSMPYATDRFVRFPGFASPLFHPPKDTRYS